jgi:hypothetical protein
MKFLQFILHKSNFPFLILLLCNWILDFMCHSSFRMFSVSHVLMGKRVSSLFSSRVFPFVFLTSSFLSSCYLPLVDRTIFFWSFRKILSFIKYNTNALFITFGLLGFPFYLYLRALNSNFFSEEILFMMLFHLVFASILPKKFICSF